MSRRRWVSPLNIEGVRFWDATVTASLTDAGSGHISQWNDLGPQGVHWVQTTDANRPVYDATGLNGHPTLGFTKAAPSRMSFASAVTDSLNFVALVFANGLTLDAAAATESPVGFHTTAGNGAIELGAATGALSNEILIVRALAAAGTTVQGYTHASDSYAVGPHFAMFFTTGSDWAIYLDSLVNRRNAISGAVTHSRPTMNTPQLGRNAASANPFGGKISAVVMASRAKPDDVPRTRDWIYRKFGI